MREFLTSIQYNSWILPALLALPVLGAVGIWIHGWLSPAPATAAPLRVDPVPRWFALVIFVLELVLSLGLWWSFEPSAVGWQMVVDLPWIPAWGSRFSVGLDGIALTMVLLTTILMPLAVLGSWTSIRVKTHAYYALMLILTTGMLGVFMALDLFFFYVMWELMLVPMYFIIGIWGGERRLYASLKFFIYTMLGSLLMLVAILWIGLATRDPLTGAMNFGYDHLMTTLRVSGTTALWLFGAFFLAFAIKVPIFPFHTWLPDAHVEAPVAGSVILAGIMLKTGTFGFIRIAVPFFPSAAMHPWVRNVILVLAVIGIIYGAVVAMVQPDFKKLVAYSSVSHLGFVMLGIFALTQQSVEGAVMVMINHGISTGALFFLIGMIYERRHSRLIDAYGGIARVVPMFAALLTLVTLSSIGLPGLNGFVGEFLVLLGAFRTQPILTTIATTGVIFAACYLLWGIQRLLYGRIDKPENRHITDLKWRELVLMAPLVVLIVWLGVYPAPVLRRMESSARSFVELVQTRSAMQTAQLGGEGR